MESGRYLENVGDNFEIKVMCCYFGQDPGIPRFYFPLPVQDPQRSTLRRQSQANRHHYLAGTLAPKHFCRTLVNQARSSGGSRGQRSHKSKQGKLLAWSTLLQIPTQVDLITLRSAKGHTEQTLWHQRKGTRTQEISICLIVQHCLPQTLAVQSNEQKHPNLREIFNKAYGTDRIR